MRHRPTLGEGLLAAVVLPAFATGATLLFFQHETAPPYFFYTLAVAVATWYAGFRYGLAALGLSIGILIYTQAVVQDLPGEPDGPRLVIWAFVAAAVALLLSLLRTAYQDLWETSERLRLVQESARVWSWELNPESGAILWSSPQAESLHRGHMKNLIERVHPEDRAAVEGALQRAVRDRTGYALEFRVLGPDAEVHWVLSRAVVFESAGRAARVVGVNTDISSRKHAEQAEVDAATGRLAADLAHQINNPLEMLISSLYLLENTCAQDPSRIYLNTAREGATRVSQLVRELLRLYPRREAH